MILTELIREAIQFGAHHKEEINNKGYDSYSATMKKFFDKHQVKNLSIHGVSNWVDSDSLPKHLEKVLVFGKLEPWSENELYTAVLNKAGGLNHWYTGGTRMHEVIKWKNIVAPPCY